MADVEDEADVTVGVDSIVDFINELANEHDALRAKNEPDFKDKDKDEVDMKDAVGAKYEPDVKHVHEVEDDDYFDDNVRAKLEMRDEAHMKDLPDTKDAVGAKYKPDVKHMHEFGSDFSDDISEGLGMKPRNEVGMKDVADVKDEDEDEDEDVDEDEDEDIKKPVCHGNPYSRIGLYRVGILGATGSVGQRFIDLLTKRKHPLFVLVAIGASERSAGMTYKDAVTWRQVNPIPEKVASMTLRRCRARDFKDCDFVFSALDADVAEKIVSHLYTLELEFASYNIAVFSNAKSNRMKKLVPVIVPTANPLLLAMAQAQCNQSGLDQGFIVCNPNCAAVGIVVPIVALQVAFGPISQLSVVTMQAVSGAGFSPGVSSIDMIDNVIPFISGEEEKIEPEIRKMLARLGSDAHGNLELRPSKIQISVSCNRVPVTDGHMACVSVTFQGDTTPPAEECKRALREYHTMCARMSLPSAPENPIEVLDEEDRPQPRLDRDRGGGFTVSVGRVRNDPSGVFDLQFTSLVHNTILGAAGASLLNAEIAVKLGHLQLDEDRHCDVPPIKHGVHKQASAARR